MASNLNGYSDETLKNIFGDNASYIKTLRDLANHGAAVEKSGVYTRINAAGKPAATLKTGSLFDKMFAPENTGKILDRYNIPEPSRFNPFTTQNAVNQTVVPAATSGIASRLQESIKNKKGLSGSLK
jgi:hypothetical protein